ncbi:hypothetical protein BDA99DRAFT_600290 [Phascolomyces articulosus]|uniref:Uncharacterized protein n=1 Tax=Phascolomyces articulosus TaxID=60185 RepID=A0AAD5KC93_9FUNG|nr:hypothetical protein BDA99DRAFT_600290 [Phascolomyces articulosus]
MTMTTMYSNVFLPADDTANTSSWFVVTLSGFVWSAVWILNTLEPEPEQYGNNSTSTPAAVSPTTAVVSTLFKHLKNSQDLLRDFTLMLSIPLALRIPGKESVTTIIFSWVFMVCAIISVLSNNKNMGDEYYDQTTTAIHKITKAGCALTTLVMINFTLYHIYL